MQFGAFSWFGVARHDERRRHVCECTVERFDIIVIACDLLCFRERGSLFGSRTSKRNCFPSCFRCWAIHEPIFPVAPVTRIKSDVDMERCTMCFEAWCRFVKKVRCLEANRSSISALSNLNGNQGTCRISTENDTPPTHAGGPLMEFQTSGSRRQFLTAIAKTAVLRPCCVRAWAGRRI